MIEISEGDRLGQYLELKARNIRRLWLVAAHQV